jgi:hypothetical protein
MPGRYKAIKINLNAKKVYIVMGNSTGQTINVKLIWNGAPVNTGKGKDVVDSQIKVDSHALYEALILDDAQQGTLELKPAAAGLEIYTFTFGN